MLKRVSLTQAISLKVLHTRFWLRRVFQGLFKRATNAKAEGPRLGATACRRASRKLAPRQDGASPWP